MLRTGPILTFYDIPASYDISAAGIHLRQPKKPQDRS
jgi:hypothetical protein